MDRRSLSLYFAHIYLLFFFACPLSFLFLMPPQSHRHLFGRYIFHPSTFVVPTHLHPLAGLLQTSIDITSPIPAR
uniref:Uncharacterized protein n=1 Tax=Lepeophtheirus salmonis TaxID=72036 RepID=A0A0K2UY50_LEPSM